MNAINRSSRLDTTASSAAGFPWFLALFNPMDRMADAFGSPVKGFKEMIAEMINA